MKSLKLIAAVLSMCLAVFAVGYKLAASSRNHVANRLNDSPAGGEVARDLNKLAPPAISSYRLDPSQSKFIAHAFAGGLRSNVRKTAAGRFSNGLTAVNHEISRRETHARSSNVNLARFTSRGPHDQ